MVRSVVSLEDLGAPLVAELLLQRGELVLDDPHQALVGGEDALQVGDERERLLVLLHDLVALELGQALQAHVEDGPRLDLRELELRHEGGLRRVGALGLADQPDHEVELIDGLAQALEDMRALLGAGEIVLRPSRDHLAAEADELLQHLLECSPPAAAGPPGPA